MLIWVTKFVGTMLFGILGAVVVGELLARSSIIERPSPVQALISRLQASRAFETLDGNPTSCGRLPRPPWRMRCYFGSVNLKVGLVWLEKSGRPSSLWIEMREPRNAPPFAWADLATSFRLLCPGITPARAPSLAGEALEKLSRQAWRKWDGDSMIASTSETEGAGRSIAVNPGSGCVIKLSETSEGTTVRATLRASFRARGAQ